MRFLRLRHRFAAVWTLALALATAAGIPAFSEAAGVQSQALIDALRQGGHVIYFRHARTDFSTRDQDRGDLSDCRTQRNLSEAGVEEARRLGAAIRALAVPVGTVLSSPYCRAIDTAQLAFGKASVTEDLRSASPERGRDEGVVARSLHNLLAAPPAAGSNTVLVAHGNNMRWAEGFQLAEGEAAVFRPDGRGGAMLVGRLTAEDWIKLSGGYRGFASPQARDTGRAALQRVRRDLRSAGRDLRLWPAPSDRGCLRGGGYISAAYWFTVSTSFANRR